ncbi:MAG TPA: hypothetical protein DCR14_10830 [Acidimicrobiaceae bacterium]|nr:hypothetical protein [Acidimicrobiaceae bacterium]
MPGRYQFSLPERRSRDGWFRIGSLDVTTTALLVILGVASMFLYAADIATAQKLGYVGPLVRDGEVWRLVTWPLYNPPNRIWVLLTLVFFWIIGHQVEERVGRQRFTVMVASMTIIPAAVVTLFQFASDTGVAYGLSILSISMLVVLAFDSPNAMWFFGIPAWIIALVFVGLDVLQLVGLRLWGALLVELGAIIVGLVIGRQYGLLDDLSFIPRFGSPGSSTSSRKKSGKRRTGQAVVQGPWQGSSPAPSGLTPLEQAELDVLLDKTSASGLDSLTAAEKARLNELSKKLRNR